jgi:hypothetical protein
VSYDPTQKRELNLQDASFASNSRKRPHIIIAKTTIDYDNGWNNSTAIQIMKRNRTTTDTPQAIKLRYALTFHFFCNAPSLITIPDRQIKITITMNAPRFANLTLSPSSFPLERILFLDNKPVLPPRRPWGVRQMKNLGRKITNKKNYQPKPKGNKKTHQGHGAPVVNKKNKNKNSSEAWMRKMIPVPERKVPSFVLLKRQ